MKLIDLRLRVEVRDSVGFIASHARDFGVTAGSSFL